MGCGSSRSAVAVVENNNNKNNNNLESSNTPKKPVEKSKDNIELFQASSSKTSLNKQQQKQEIENEKNKKEHKAPSRTSSIISTKDANNNTLKRNSLQSLKDENRKPSTASSAKSGDSGVYDEGDRMSSAKSRTSHQSVASLKPPSGKKSSARQRLLRIDDQALTESTVNETDNNGLNMVERPKTRFGNVAFDLVLDMPETGNAKKRPDLLPALESKRKKRSKKVKTKEEIEKKMQEVEERRKVQEKEKQMKAKQFQHLAIHTTVQPFMVEDEEEETDTLENKDLKTQDLI